MESVRGKIISTSFNIWLYLVWLVDGTAGSVERVSVSPPGIMPHNAVSPMMLAIRVSMGVSWVAACPPPVNDVSGLWAVTRFLAFSLMSNHFFLNFGNLLSDPWVDSICHPIPRSVFSFVGNTSVQCSKQYILVRFNPSNKHFNLRVREVSFLRPLCHDSGEGKRIHSRIIKGIVTTIYGQLEAFLNANDSNHARAWWLRTGGIYHHGLLTGVRTSAVRTVDKYRFFCTYTHSKFHSYERI